MNGEKQAIRTELRDFGDNKTIVLYTNDNRVYRQLQDSTKLIKIVPYEQEQRGKLALIAVDVYLPKEYRKLLKKNIGVDTQKVE